MARLLLGLVLGLLLFLPPSSAIAAEEDGRVFLSGIGVQLTCGEYVRRSLNGDHALAEVALAWVMGFVSGRNMYHEGNATIPAIDGISQYVSQYCATHPSEPLVRAAVSLVGEYGGPGFQYDRGK